MAGMEYRKDMHICMFKPSKTDDHPDDSRIRAGFEAFGEQHYNIHDAASKGFALTAWAILLKYYLATDHISFASFGMGSEVPVIHSLDVSDEDKVCDVVKRVQQESTQRLFQVDLLPFFNTALVYHSGSDLPRHDLVAFKQIVSPANNEFDICLTLIGNQEISRFELDMCSKKFSQPLAHRLLNTYQTLLETISVQNPHQEIGKMDPLTREDLEEICAWNAVTPQRSTDCLHSVFEKRVREHSELPAICSWDGELSYGELDAVATKLAHYLTQLGVRPEVLVPCAFEKSKYAVISTLAVLKAGGAFVPMDASHPQERLKSILARTQARLVLVSAHTAQSFENLVPKLLVVDRRLFDGLPEQNANPPSSVRPDNSAFVLFTSGSTGEPKGLIQEHASVCTINEAYRGGLSIDGESRVLNFAAYTFDVSTVDVFTTLYHGGCVCIPSESDRLNDLVGIINKFRVNWVDLTPSFAIASIPNPEEVPTLKTLVLAGEEVKREHVAHFVGKIDRVINCYGPAEAGGCLAHTYQNAASQPQTVGRQLRNIRCWIVDVNSHERLVPIGATGVLVVESPTLARGYLGDAKRTSAAFFHYPLQTSKETGVPLRRFYSTGDLVRYRPDGLIDFVGRQDTQVKVRGQRIELAEIEQHLSDDITIKRSLVSYPRAGVFGNRLVAIIEPRLDCQRDSVLEDPPLQPLPLTTLVNHGFSLNRIKASLASKLPSYMVPAAWLIVNSLPLTNSQKIDRRSVTEWLIHLPTASNLSASHERLPNSPLPADNILALEISQKTIEIIANGNSQVAIALNGQNFDLRNAGIDSIQVVTLSKWIQSKYGLKLTVDKLNREGLTIDRLAQGVAAYQAGHEPTNLLASGPDVLQEISQLCSKFDSAKACPTNAGDSVAISNVFLTGGTGFLGIEILYQLLCMPDVKRIVLLVRAKDNESGLERVITSAKRAGWWSEHFYRRIEVWPGDLGQIKLGLNGKQWGQLTGGTGVTEMIDVIIHNGAVVHWGHGYENLKSQNTMSTAHLLQAMAERTAPGQLVYVSGGQQLTIEEENENTLAAKARSLTGYGQSKVVSELLVKRFAASDVGQSHIMRVVKPSYIIGDAHRGQANTSDYLWKLTKAVIELGSYDGATRNDWLFVSDLVTVAKAACHIHSATTSNLTLVTILDGISMKDFWDVLIEDFSYRLNAVDGQKWWPLLRAHVEESGSEHCLWALQDILEAGKGNIASNVVATPTMSNSSVDMLRAVRSNIEYLKNQLKFLPATHAYRERL